MSDSAAVSTAPPREEIAPPAAEPPALAPAAFSALRPGEVDVLGPFAVPGLAPRRLRLYLPRGWTRGEPRHALVMFDGQNLFDDGPSHAGGWHLDEAVERHAASRRPAPVVVGVDHGGEERIAELSPFPLDDGPGNLDLLLDWIAGTLLPAVAAAVPLHPPPAGIAAGGSSMGGLAALWAHFRRPEVFGGALALSPSLQLAGGAILDALAALPAPPVSRVYLDAGAREGRGSLLPLAAQLAEQLARRGYGPGRLLWRPDARGAHNEASWRRRLPKALRFMYR